MKALQEVSFSIDAGEIVSIIGENGAGKSTLMKVVSGVHQPDSGEILLDGAVKFFPTPKQALDAGIRIIYQELSVLDNLTIGQNIFLGREPKRGFLVDDRTIQLRSEEILKQVGLKKDPRTLLGDLSLAEKQLVEIARALSMDARVLIFDEPTSSLTLEETNNLLALIARLKESGVAQVYISHRLDEVRAISDRVVGLRDGKNAGGLDKVSITHEAMVRMMVGRDLGDNRRESTSTAGRTIVSLNGVRTTRFPQHSIDLELRAGEILGMAGLVGAGRTELARAVAGVEPFIGKVLFEGNPTVIKSPKDAIKLGIFLAPEDRRAFGLTVDFSVEENLVLPNLPLVSKGVFVNSKASSGYSKAAVAEFGVKTASIKTQVSTLSGGNQQKVVLARWLKMGPKLLIVDEPTRGIDVGSKAEIYAQLRALADQGVAIWMISSDMEEVLRVSDRIAVMREGRITGILEGPEATEESVMALAVAN